MTRRIAIIGSNSFSAQNFIDLLLEDPSNELIGISRSPEKDEVFIGYHRHENPKFQFFQFDLNQDFEKIKYIFSEFQPEYIVNFAAQSEVLPSWENPWDWIRTNAVSLTYLADYLKDVKYLKKFIQISSPEIYGSCKGSVKENTAFNPSTPYASSKAAADLLLFSYAKNFNFPLTVVRATNVYGPHQQLFKIIPKTIISIKSGLPLYLDGGGEAIKSYIHIRDVSRAKREILFNGRVNEVFHISPDKSIAVKEVVKIICDKMNVGYGDVVKNVKERLGQDTIYAIDSSKVRQEFGWKPEISLEEGIEQVIAWIEKYWPRIKMEPHQYIHKN